MGEETGTVVLEEGSLTYESKISTYSALGNSLTGRNHMKPAISGSEVLGFMELGINQALMPAQKVYFWYCQ